MMTRITLIVIFAEAALAAVGLGVSRWIGTPVLDRTRVDLPSTALALAATIPLTALVLRGMRLELGIATRLRKVFREVVVPLFAGCSRLEFLLLSIMAGVGEEIFFRGFLQGSLARVVSPWIALAVVSVLFGLAHCVTVDYAVVTALIGVYLGALFLWTGNLFVAIAVHALFDFVALSWLVRPVSKVAR